jgi:hypothetical protein
MGRNENQADAVCNLHVYLRMLLHTIMLNAGCLIYVLPLTCMHAGQDA